MRKYESKQLAMNNVRKQLVIAIFMGLTVSYYAKSQDFQMWHKAELGFKSDKLYDNPLYDVKDFYVVLKSPSGKEIGVDGFWDGKYDWKVRFKPDETGPWQYETICTDENNTGLHGVRGTFNVIPGSASLAIYQKGRIIHPAGTYHLSYHDGTPFFWTACTVWNGALRSTDEEWERYLKHRVDNGYNVIQFVTTQWRGGPANAEGQTAYTKDGPIAVNVDFFDRMDKKVDEINKHGLIAAPVMLWALPVGEGRHLSPGYDLPFEDAFLLGRYIKARYGGNHVIWILGGDARYYNEMESKWKHLGRQLFKRKQNLVSLHPHGRSWVGSLYNEEDWLDIIGYQSSHSNKRGTVDWINKGPVVAGWGRISPRPIINMEPNYEEIGFRITARDVRNASYWSIFSTPVSGITYGANGLWPWLRKGEMIINHGETSGYSDWETSMKFPGSIQIGYLAGFFRQYEWWDLRPANELLAVQPGDDQYNEFISVLKSPGGKIMLAYLPSKHTIRLRTGNEKYQARWFDPSKNEYHKGKPEVKNGLLMITPPSDSDWVLELKAE